jgi:uncharacterized protein YfiM (DUF2279 family)
VWPNPSEPSHKNKGKIMRNVGLFLMGVGLWIAGCGSHQFRGKSPGIDDRDGDKTEEKRDGETPRKQAPSKYQLVGVKAEDSLKCDASGCDVLIQALMGTYGKIKVQSVTACLMQRSADSDGSEIKNFVDFDSCDNGTKISLKLAQTKGLYEARLKALPGSYWLSLRQLLTDSQGGGGSEIEIKQGSQKFVSAAGYDCTPVKAEALLGLPVTSDSGKGNDGQPPSPHCVY